MRVMCIDDNWNKGEVTPPECPKMMEIVTVYCNATSRLGNKCYVLNEYSKRYMWEQENFVPLSEIDETELVNNKEEYV